MRKWREMFRISQVEVSRNMGVSPSVISDYEKGRRTPGSMFIKRFVESLLSIDENRGWIVVKKLAKSMNIHLDSIEDMCEFEKPIHVTEFIKLVKGELLTPSDYGKVIYGYTVLDSIKTILSLTGNEFYQIMGMTSERALIFTRVTAGRSPMVAVRTSPLKPAAVVLHGPRKVDELAIKLAELEKIPLILSLHRTVRDIIRSLRIICEKT
ncbi:MAG: transcriptional regulator [Desulfurococcales archaeon ex4484_217_2]|nr:MAG: transcriptional regulator [Desulfurococcales archaeon ex4484_217_2]